MAETNFVGGELVNFPCANKVAKHFFFACAPTRHHRSSVVIIAEDPLSASTGLSSMESASSKITLQSVLRSMATGLASLATI